MHFLLGCERFFVCAFRFLFKCTHVPHLWRQLAEIEQTIEVNLWPKRYGYSNTIPSDKFMAFCWMHHLLECGCITCRLEIKDYSLAIKTFLFPMKFAGKPEQLISVSVSTHMSIQVNRQFAAAVYQLTDTNKSFVHCYRFLFRKMLLLFRSSWENWVAIKPIWNVITIIDWSLRANCYVEIRLGVDYSVCSITKSEVKWRRIWLCIEWQAN